MPKEMKTSIQVEELTVRVWTLIGKKGMISVPQPDQHIVEVAVKKGNTNAILREFFFDNWEQAVGQYNQILRAIGS